MAQPDPPYAAGVDPDVPAADPPADRWVRFDGPEPQSVIHVGGWEPGDVKHVPGWVAARLLTRADFTEADEPVADDEPAPARASRRRVEPAPEPAADASDVPPTP